MTFPLARSPRDQAALDAARALGALPILKAEALSELTPLRAVLIGLARHLADLEASVENDRGPPTSLKFRFVRDEWPTGTEPANYPSATLLPQVTAEWDAVTGVPVQLRGEDVISPDGRWGLWKLGEDVGTGIVHVFASYEAHRDALQAAVEQALFGSLNPLQGLALPLPDVFLPRPFRDFFDAVDAPRAHVLFQSGGGPVDDMRAGESGLWRGDVYFRWQAPRFATRPRIADQATDITVRVGPPGEEI